MTAEEMWKEYAQKVGIEHSDYEAWAFGDAADELAALTVEGKKTATSSAFPLYESEGEPLPRAGEHSVILNSRGQAVCVIRTEKVYLAPFREISEEHARREGEGDLSLAYWREVHERFFRREMEEAGLRFDQDMPVVCEEFSCVYVPGDMDHDLVPGGKRHHSIIEKIQADLWELRDEGYKDFQAKLIPTVDPGTIIGVRIPQLRKYARKLARDPQIGEFLEQLPHSYYDENNLHAFVVEQIRDYEECLEQTRRFLPYVDNWATCDMMAPKVFRSHREALLTPICEWIASGETYTIRYGMGMLMRFYLEEDFKPEYLRIVAEVSSSEYYVNMMRAWYFATALSKQYEAALPYIREKRLDSWTHNKTIQKACESFRITAEQKKYLRGLKVSLTEKQSFYRGADEKAAGQNEREEAGWICPDCGRGFERRNQNHFCGKKPGTVDAYIAAQPEDRQPFLQAVRDAIRKAIHEAEEKISWSMPTFWKGHNIIHFAGFKNHVGLYPGTEAVEEFADRLKDCKTSKGSIQFLYSRPIPLELIADIARWCYKTGKHP